jgi:hypothetical protein
MIMVQLFFFSHDIINHPASFFLPKQFGDIAA